AFERYEVADLRAALDEKAAMAERDHREDREADEMPVAVPGVDHEPAERCLAASVRRIMGHWREPMVHIIREINALRDDLTGQQRRHVVPGVPRKLQREASHAQAPSIENNLAAPI